MRGLLLYAGWGVARRGAVNRLTYVWVAIASMLVFMSIAIRDTSATQLAGLAPDAGDQFGEAAAVVFMLGILVSVAQTWLLSARLIEDRRAELILLVTISASRLQATVTALAEQLTTALVGSCIGTIVSTIIYLGALWQLGQMMTVSRGLFDAIAAAAIVPVLAPLPLIALLVWRYSVVVNKDA